MRVCRREWGRGSSQPSAISHQENRDYCRGQTLDLESEPLSVVSSQFSVLGSRFSVLSSQNDIALA